MRSIHRWGVVLAGALVAVGAPIVVRAIPAHDTAISARALLARIESAGDPAYTGEVETRGRLSLPLGERATELTSLLGGTTHLRVWWRAADDWRVATLLPTGETDLFHQGDQTTRWSYERHQAVTGRDPAIRLPWAADLLPPALAGHVLADVATFELTRLPAHRVAGRDVLGLRVRPAAPQASIDHVDLWADAATGVVLRVEVYAEASTPVLTTGFTRFDTRRPTLEDTTFSPPPGLHATFDSVLDLADAANQYAPVVAPPTFGGLVRSPASRRAVGLYGTGITQVLAVPLRERDAGPLRRELVTDGGRSLLGSVLLRVGPLGVMLTEYPDGSGWLTIGTVTDATLLQGARDLTTGSRFLR